MKVAVIIPCLNEQAAILKVVKDCRHYLPKAEIYVLDNASEDDTAEVARQAGAHVIHSPLRGKGHVVRHAFRVLDADYFLLIDGDGTYPVAHAPRLLEIARTYNYEMVMGARLKNANPEAFRPLHFLGNKILTGLVRRLFAFPVEDLLTGYRVFSRRFARQVRLTSKGFEIETELTIRALAQNMAFCEVAIPYSERHSGGHSKLRTFRDGALIIAAIFRLFIFFKPLLSFSIFAFVNLGLAQLSPREWSAAWIINAGIFLALGFYLDWQIKAGSIFAHSENAADTHNPDSRSNSNAA